MQNNRVWELVHLPNRFRPLDCKWIYKTKKYSKEKVIRHKEILKDLLNEKELVKMKLMP